MEEPRKFPPAEGAAASAEGSGRHLVALVGAAWGQDWEVAFGGQTHRHPLPPLPAPGGGGSTRNLADQ